MRKTNFLLFTSFLSFVILIFTQSCDKEIDKSPPGEVINLLIKNGNSMVTLTWIDPLDIDLLYIEITYIDSTINVLKGIQKIIIENLNNEIEYNFKIQTIDVNGNKSIGLQIIGIPNDSRNQYIGSYKFVSYFSIEYLLLSQPYAEYDTIEYIGSIEKHYNNKLMIIFKSPYNEPDIKTESFPMSSINGLIYPTLEDSGRLSYPELVDSSNYNFFSGKFINEDSISFIYGMRCHPGRELNIVQGKKISK